jgi:hypothetical protein
MSDIRANTIGDASGNGPINLTGQSASKAYVRYAMNSQPAGASLNISTIDDNKAGDFNVNFTASFSSSAIVAVSGEDHTGSRSSNCNNNTSSNMQILFWQTAIIDNVHATNGLTDSGSVGVMFNGDLA